jgi:hypothetical protein
MDNGKMENAFTLKVLKKMKPITGLMHCPLSVKKLSIINGQRENG